MAVNVNPPPQLRIPDVVLKNPEWREYERQRDVILFQLWQRTGGDNDGLSELIAELADQKNLLANLESLGNIRGRVSSNKKDININSEDIQKLKQLMAAD